MIVVNAVDNTVVSPNAGGKIVNNLFCGALFLRMGGHFLRLIAGIEGLLADNVDWVTAPSSRDLDELLIAEDYKEELAGYLRDTYHMSVAEMSRDFQPSSAHQSHSVSYEM